MLETEHPAQDEASGMTVQIYICRKLQKAWAAWHQGLAAWRLQDMRDQLGRVQAEFVQVHSNPTAGITCGLHWQKRGSE